MYAAGDKENQQGPGPRLQRRSLPAAKSAFLNVSKQAAPSLLALARRPLGDTRNIQQHNINSVSEAGIKTFSQECGTLLGGASRLHQPTVMCTQQSVPTADQDDQPAARSLNCQDVDNVGTLTQPNLSAEENEEDAGIKDGNIIGSSVSFTKCNEKVAPEMVSDRAPQFNSLSALEIPNQSWWDVESHFFPSVLVGLGEDGSCSQAGESVSTRDGSAGLPLRYQPLVRRNPKCLTPISETSFLKEEEPEVGEGKGNGDGIMASYQNTFAQDCAVVIDNIRRTSCQGLQGVPSNVRTLDTLDVTDIREESLPQWVKSHIESPTFLSEVDVSMSNGSLLSICLDLKGRGVKTEKEKMEELQSSAKIFSVTFSPKDSLMLMRKTQSIHEMDNTGAPLDMTYSLCDDKDSGAQHVQNVMMAAKVPDSLDSKDSSVHSSANCTYVRHSDDAVGGPNTTVDLIRPSVGGSETEPGNARSTSSPNDTYELQPVLEKASVEVSKDEGGDVVKVSPASRDNKALADSLCDNIVDAVQGVPSMLILDDTLDIKNNLLVTSTPMPLPGGVWHVEETEAISEVCRQLMLTDSVDACVKGDAIDLGDKGSAASVCNSDPPAVDVEVPLKGFPRSTAVVPSQEARSQLSDVFMRRKSIAPSSSVLTNGKTLLPVTRPSASRHLSLPALAKASKVPHVSSGAAVSAKPTRPPAFGKKSPSKALKSAGRVEAPAIPATCKKEVPSETKPPARGFQKPQECGTTARLSCASKLTLGGQTQAKAAQAPGLKGRTFQASAATLKQPRHNMDDSLPVSKKKRADVPSGATEVPEVQVTTARSTQGLRKPTASLKDPEAKPKISAASCTTSGAAVELSKPAKGMLGLKRPTARLKGLQVRLKNPATITAASVQPFPSEKGSSVSIAKDKKYCENCVRYQEEIERLRSVLQELTGIGATAECSG